MYFRVGQINNYGHACVSHDFSCCLTIFLAYPMTNGCKNGCTENFDKKKGFSQPAKPLNSLERETGFEPATSTLARLHSTTELFPLGEKGFIAKADTACQ